MNELKNLQRLSLILVIIGFCLLTGAIVRSNPQPGPAYGWMAGTGNYSSAQWDSSANSCFFPARSLQINVNFNSTVDIYVMNPDNLREWNQTGELKYTSTFHVVGKGICTMQIAQRGEYTFLIHNLSKTPLTGQMNLVFYGLETDLMWSSIVFIFVGISTMLISLIIFRKKPDNKIIH